MSDETRFRKLPVEIEAWDTHQLMIYAASDWQAVPQCIRDEYEKGNVIFAADCIFITTLEGVHRADPADKIIKGVKGELYPCKPDIFAATYESVEQPSTPPPLTCDCCHGKLPCPAHHQSTPPARPAHEYVYGSYEVGSGGPIACAICGRDVADHATTAAQTEAKPVQPWMEAAAKEIKGECCDNQCSNSDIHFVTAIIAAHAPSSPEEWQPIETAPRDGSHFIAANLTPGHIGFGYFEDKTIPFCDVVHYWPNEGEEGFYPSNGPDEPYTFLTHWKPLGANPVQPCVGMPHYYCINPSCQWVAHFKPVERKCPKCGNTVWKEGATTLQHKSVPLCEADHAPSSSAMPDKPYLTALRIMLEGRSGAAQNAVRGDYPEMAAIVDQHRSSASEYESASEWYVRMGFTVIAFGLDEAFTLAERYAAERRVR